MAILSVSMFIFIVVFLYYVDMKYKPQEFLKQKSRYP